MVGVPRSKGCHTCRRRKIKCTLERPYCSPCTRTGRTCEGYQKDHIFVTTTTTKTLGKTAEPSSSRWRPDAYRVASGQSSPKPASRARSASQTTRREVAPKPPPFFHRYEELDRTFLRDQLLNSFIANCITTTTTSPNSRSTHWLANVPSMLNPTRALQLSVFALCTARLGRLGPSPDQVLLIQSQKLYGQGLQALSAALASPKLRFGDETLGACVLLAMYEVFECSSGDRSGYLTHHRGCEKLIEARGPEAHRVGLGHSLFLGYRIMSAMEATARRRSFLAEPAWKTIPFEVIDKSPYDILQDICLEAPDLIDRAEKIFTLHDPVAQLQLTLDLTDTIWGLERTLEEFYKDLENSANGPLFWFDSVDFVDVEHEDPLCLTPYCFYSLSTARTLSLYWAMVVSVWAGLEQIYDLIKRLTLANAPNDSSASRIQAFPALDHRKEIAPLARNVLRSVDFCMRDDLSMPALSCPLTMVLVSMVGRPDCEAEIAAVRVALGKIARWGVGLVRYLPEWVVIDAESSSAGVVLVRS